jgi:uncharacterized protein (TIGR02246 family)
MTRSSRTLGVLLAGQLVATGWATMAAQQPPAAAAAVSTADIDREIWTVLVESVRTDNITQMASTYAPDAVLVTPRTTQAMRDALAGWGRDMVANKAKGTTAKVEFRFSRRMDNATTAFESGIFNYTTIDSAGVAKPGLYPFEELLVKKDGHWQILMERQFAAASQADWDKLPKWPER